MVWCAAFAFQAKAATVNCLTATQEIEGVHKRLNELHSLWAEMTNLFGDVEEAESPGKKKAPKKVKIESSRKRLKAKIDGQEARLDKLTTTYCTTCAPTATANQENLRFCEFCAELDSCQTK